VILFIAAPLSAPLNLRHTSLTEYSVTLVWKELDCPQRGGPLAYYDVRLDDIDERSDVIVDHVTSPTVQFAVLTPYRQYAARVRYVNDVGVGPYSSQLVFTTLATGNAALTLHAYTSRDQLRSAGSRVADRDPQNIWIPRKNCRSFVDATSSEP